MSSGHIDNFRFEVSLGVELFDPGKDRRQEAQSFTCASWRLKESVRFVVEGSDDITHVFNLNLIRFVWKVNLLLLNHQFLLIF